MLACVFSAVGEEDEVSIRDIALMIAEAMEFKGEVVVREREEEREGG